LLPLPSFLQQPQPPWPRAQPLQPLHQQRPLRPFLQWWRRRRQ